MLLAHRIRLDPTEAQRDYFVRAAGTARRVWNWALAEWKRRSELGISVRAFDLKKQFNAIKYTDPEWLDANGRPWLRDIHRDAHSQPFANLGKAYLRFHAQLRTGQEAHPPRFKKKGRCRDSFYLANDQFTVHEQIAVLPKIGPVAMRERLRLEGKIMGANVTREADHWYLSIHVEISENEAHRKRKGSGVIGLDVGITNAVTMNTGIKLKAPRPLRAAMRRLRIRARRHARKLETPSCDNHRKYQRSTNSIKATRSLARLHARIAHIRIDWTHKLTTWLCRKNQAVAIEDLNVRAMLRNRRLARSIADIGWYRIRAQLEYKTVRYDTLLVIADRWYPSSKLCSACGVRHGGLTLAERTWICLACKTNHDRDINAAVNLQRLATVALAKRTALPVAGSAVTPDPIAGIKPAGDGKVTPVRYELG